MLRVRVRWPAGLEPASPGSRRVGPFCRYTTATNGDPAPGSTAMRVGGRVYFLAFSLAGSDSTPYREVD